MKKKFCSKTNNTFRLQLQLDSEKNNKLNKNPNLRLPMSSKDNHKCDKKMNNFIIPKKFNQMVSEFCYETKIPKQLFFLTIFKFLLYRFTGKKEIIIGYGLEIPKKIAPLHTHITESKTFTELLDYVYQCYIKINDYTESPNLQVSNSITTSEDTLASQYYNILFLYNVSDVDILNRFELILSIEEGQEEVGSIIYDINLFEDTAIEKFIASFQDLLVSILASPNEQLSTLLLSDTSEQYQFLTKPKETLTPYPNIRGIHELFEIQASQNPDAIAVVYENKKITYGELNIKSNQLAHYLINLGVELDSLIGLYVERSPEMIVGILAILKAGGAYVPLDAKSPKERLIHMLKDSEVSIMLTQTDLLTNLPKNKTKLICLDKMSDEISKMDILNLPFQGTDQNLAYVIYTSGTTGNPKGVMVQHSSVLNLSNELQNKVFGAYSQNQMQISLNAPITFDASVQQLQMLFYGHCLYILPEEVRRNPEVFLSFIQRNRLDVIDCTPSFLEVLVQLGLLNNSQTIHKPRIVLVGGEAINPLLWEKLKESNTIDFYNMYGPTECTVDSTCCNIKKAGNIPSIGEPLGNVEIYVLDENLLPVPIGIPGELYIGGAGVARGYLNQQSLTEKHFLLNPFSIIPGERLYKTGDWVRYLENGELEFIGRQDEQVKIRGFRIELKEIEMVLARHPQVKQQVVQIHYTKQKNARVIAYVVQDNGANTSEIKLKNFLKDYLPDYMIPTSIIILDRLPLTSNGKLDVANLPDPYNYNRGTHSKAVANEIESQLLKIWKELLDIQSIAVNDHFFHLGGNSLLASQVIVRIRKFFQVEIPMNFMLENPTLEKLANEITNRKQMVRNPNIPLINAVSRKDYYVKQTTIQDELESSNNHDNTYSREKYNGDVQNEIEFEIMKIWNELLGIQSININDHFFYLGGNSLLASLVVIRMRKVFQIEIPISLIFDNPTLLGLANEVINRKDTTKKQNVSLINPISRENYRIKRHIIQGGLESLNDSEK
ncbi:amino acid adenylation protein [Bacillus pseudomycoides]|uniref:amino acid adenylation domain-containing protein n=1 Tax=Bacillus pseudomycoides TaxID=64104 RepID=UPI000BF42F6B|nr:amino acid adenylation domain-containing protein [Bacillus pseudomycoides]PFW88944.1 amino acid adenylation protein [Bacillus pseudomycoides]PFX43749.1 amino acid adenylation protein [Bacillus pseudomycoides]